jgi:hypothetical protein
MHKVLLFLPEYMFRRKRVSGIIEHDTKLIAARAKPKAAPNTFVVKLSAPLTSLFSENNSK